MKVLRVIFPFIAASLVLFASGSSQGEEFQRIRLVRMNSLMFYVPEHMVRTGSLPTPPFDTKLPLDTVFDASRGGFVISLMRLQDAKDGMPFELPDSPELWEDFFVPKIHIGPRKKSGKPFRERFPHGTPPIEIKDPRVILDCSSSYYTGRYEQGPKFHTCFVDRIAGDEIYVRYTWAGFFVHPDEWARQDGRVQNLIEWLMTPSKSRPSVVPDVAAK